MKKYEINQDLLLAVLEYLGKKPFAEVAQLFNALNSVKEIKEEVKEQDAK